MSWRGCSPTENLHSGARPTRKEWGGRTISPVVNRQEAT
uniref:Uncharacterized protein n=1 Tax=Siphoviridae sp. ctZF426 TaxID=2827580 RepID=A0A8S5RSP1_9CAUD|nr:MAG TPA: hypothetical protein [Siphoviridae sp. ctZF426]